MILCLTQTAPLSDFVRWRKRKKRKKQITAIAAVCVVDCVIHNSCERLHCCKRLDWDKLVHELNPEGPDSFHRVCRMHHSSCAKLCQLINPLVQKSTTTSHHRATAISTKLALHCCVLWLAGHHHSSICCWTRISDTTFCDHARKCIESINSLNALGCHFPTTRNGIEEVARGFQSLGSHNLIDGCVAATDGFLAKSKSREDKKLAKSNLFVVGITKPVGSTCERLVTTGADSLAPSQVLQARQTTSTLADSQ